MTHDPSTCRLCALAARMMLHKRPDRRVAAPPRERDPLGRAARVYVRAMVARGAWDRGMHLF